MVDTVTIQTPEAGFEAPVEETPTTTTEGSTERPAWLPAEFDTPEAFAARYAELAGETSTTDDNAEAEASTEEATAEENAEETEENAEEETNKEPSGDPVRDLLTSKGIDYDALTEQYAADGGLSDESYAKLEEQGYPKALVDNYLAGEQMRIEQAETRLYSIVGGKDQFAVMAGWAASALSEKEVQSLNTAFASGNEASAEMAMSTLKLKYEAANGRTPKTVGGRTKAATTKTYSSAAEISRAVNDPRYRSDPAYRAEVEEKIARSSIF